MGRAKRIAAAAEMRRMREKATAAAERAVAAAEKAQATAAAKSEAAEKAKAKAAEKTEAAQKLLADARRLEAEETGTGSASEDPEAAGTGSAAAYPPAAAATVVKDERAALTAWEAAQQATKAAEEASETAKKTRREADWAKESAERAAESQKGVTAENGAVANMAAKATMKAAREANIWAKSVEERAGKATATTVELHDLEIRHHVAAGLDVHKEKIVACVLGVADAPEGPEIREFGTDTGDLDAMAGWLVGLGAGIAIMESTGIYWYRAFHRLREAGVNAVSCDAREIKNVKGRKTDMSDARWMANIARFDLVRHCRVLPKEVEGVRRMSNFRRGHVEDKTEIKNRVHKILIMNGFNVSQIATDVFGATSMIILEGLVRDDAPATILARAECAPGCRIVIGGAPCNEEVRAYPGADLWAPTAMDTVAYANKVHGL
jgi:hypothetical protein